jgi:hypothetical protein
VPAHRVRERHSEQPVVAAGQPAQDVGQPGTFLGGQIRHGAAVRAGQDEGLERPHRPERHERHEVLVMANDAFALLEFDAEIVAEQAATAPRVRLLLVQFPGRLVGQPLVGPDLPVRVRIAGAHHGASILEDQDVVHPVDGAEFGVPGPLDVPQDRRGPQAALDSGVDLAVSLRMEIDHRAVQPAGDPARRAPREAGASRSSSTRSPRPSRRSPTCGRSAGASPGSTRRY